MSELIIEAPSTEPIITFTRIFKAPRALVWKAYTEREHVAHWWGPRTHGAVRIVTHDFTPGGRWRYEQTTEHGVVAFFGSFVEIDAPERYINTFGFDAPFGGTDGKEGRETQTFEDLGDTTRYFAISHIGDFAERDAILATGMQDGASEQFDQLAAYLSQMDMA